MWPKSGIKDFIESGVTSNIMTLRKLVATTKNEDNLEMNKLSIKIKWKLYNKNDFEMSQYASCSDRPEKCLQI